MPRITVNVSEEVEEWLESEAERLNWSKAKAGGHCIKTLYSDVNHIDVQHIDVKQSDVHTDTALTEALEASPYDDVAALVATVADLEDRVDDLEAGGDTDTADRAAPIVAHTPADDAPDDEAATVDTAAVRERVRAQLDEGPPRKAHVRDAVVDAVALLATEGPLATGDLQDRVYEEYADHYSTPRTFWNSVADYVEPIDGVEKTYGEWSYTAPDAV